MKKMPYGITDYKELRESNLYYVDKTMYLSKLEDASKKIVYLRPGRFGKTLFTSMMYYYYDIGSIGLFDKLYKDTYVYNNPTPNKNNYYVLKLDFSGVKTANRTITEMEKAFTNKVEYGIEKFNNYYDMNFIVNKSLEATDLINEFFVYFDSLKLEHKLYILIDEYDNFTNAILEGDAQNFKSLVGNEGIVKNFYSAIKENMGTIVDRVFITGICPITLDSMTTGFNIATDISTNIIFNSMIGLTHNEVKTLIKEIESDENKQEKIYNIMIENYDGYLFNEELIDKDRVFNGTLVMYFLKNYSDFNRPPKELIDSNIAFNYGKIKNLVMLQNNSYYKEILDNILKTSKISGELKVKFNLEEEFTRDDIISLLYYFGYLTIDKEGVGRRIEFIIPNYVNQGLYNNYFVKILSDYNININDVKKEEYMLELVVDGKIDKVSKYVSELLKYTDNRIFMKFDEKYIQLMYFTLLNDMKEYMTYTEYPAMDGYVDIYLRGNTEYTKYNVMIELKYIKKFDYRKNKKLLKEKRDEAYNQLIEYSKDKRINKDNLRKYIVVFVGNDLKILESI